MRNNNKKLDRADKIASWRLCMGCGACKWACPNKAITLKDVVDRGIRPFIDESKCEKCGSCAEVCPGISLDHEVFPKGVIEDLKEGWGPILQLHEGYAADEKIRFAGSSGGAVTALSLYCLEVAGFAGVLHIKVDPDDPIVNVPTFSTTREEIVQATGSRYAPAAPCQAFDLIKMADGPCMFVGKPCDCAALRKACEMDKELKKKVGLIVSIFCAGTPPTAGTHAVLRSLGVSEPNQIKSFRYRGNGWPGMTTAELSDVPVNETENSLKMTYADAWGGVLSGYGQLRCRLCPDSTGEFADISCGDPWYRETNGDPGRSLILLRTKKGFDFYDQGGVLNYVKSEKACPDILPASQKALYKRRCQIYARLKTVSLFSISVPLFSGFSLEKNWEKNSTKVKLKTYIGTFRRIFKKRWLKPEIIRD